MTALKKSIHSIQEFFKTESSSGIILMISTLIALVIANSPFSAIYFELFQEKLAVNLIVTEINKPLILWINDGLMAIFFLLIGLEIKRELLYGELSDFKAAVAPVVAAIGGAIVPGLIFYTLNAGTEFSDGWAIAIATDIAFAIGILTLLGSKVPIWAKVFLTAVAVVDDLIAVLVIALFYTSSIKMVALAIAAGSFTVLLILNFTNQRSLVLYLIVGLVMWVAFLKSGVHATIAGVLLGLTIPANTRDEDSESPLEKMEHWLHPWVAYGIIPIFAFANAGVAINGDMIAKAMSSTLTWGIIIGLFVGKQVGIFLSVSAIRKFIPDVFPDKKGTGLILYGLACLSGVGFTMSLFIAGLSFTDAELLEYTKVGIIAGSLLSGLIGFLIIRAGINKLSVQNP
ncbi:MAG TPA: Na+/H+ antiporter NhaA [Balneolaceae bacterium]|nr:Na+/H+ antiporter NhaA [Balneolaceae bacterium]|tara:strand:+ start:197718 stop:198917 length:1200 start_codon:yes stop_codon:yes gene_type:complete